MWSFDFATLAALSALPQPSASRDPLPSTKPSVLIARHNLFLRFSLFVRFRAKPLTAAPAPLHKLSTASAPAAPAPLHKLSTASAPAPGRPGSAVGLPAWPPQLWASCVATPGSGFAPFRDCRLAPSKPSNLLCSFQPSPAWPPQLWASCVVTPGSGFAQKLPYRSETAVWPPQNPRTFSAASSRRPASVASPALGQLCGHARQRLRAEASLPFRDCRLAPSKPSNLLCSFQPSPCQLWPPQLWLASVASPALGQLCGHARQRLRAEASLPFRDCRLAPSKPSNLLCSFQPSPCQRGLPSSGPAVWPRQAAASCRSFLIPFRDCRLAPSKPSNLLCSFQPSPCQRGLPSSGPTVWPRQAAASRRSFLTVPRLPFGPLKTPEPSLQLPAVALPAWPPQLWANCVATPGSGFAQKLPYRSETAVWPPQNPRTFSAASSRRLASCGLPSSGLPAWPPQLWASCVATPGSGFAQKLPYRSETAVWPPQNPRTFSATIHVSTVTCKNITGGLYQEFGTSRALMRSLPNQKKGSAAPGR